LRQDGQPPGVVRHPVGHEGRHLRPRVAVLGAIPHHNGVDAFGERGGHGALVRSSGLGCGFSAGGLVGVQLLFLYWVVAWL